MTDDPSIIRVLDTETTGTEPTDAVVEIGWSDVTHGGNGWSASPPVSHLVDPCRPIPPETMAVHHITNEMVKGCLTLDLAMSRYAIVRDVEVLAAHKADFERQFITAPGLDWICTYKCAVTLAPNAPSFKNQALRYWLGLDVDPALASPPHRAGPDAYVTASLLARMLNARKKDSEEPLTTVARMIEISSGPIVLPRFTFGKHALQPLAEVPGDYLDWILRQKDMEPDIHHTARHHLELRRKENTDGWREAT